MMTITRIKIKVSVLNDENRIKEENIKTLFVLYYKDFYSSFPVSVIILDFVTSRSLISKGFP